MPPDVALEALGDDYLKMKPTAASVALGNQYYSSNVQQFPSLSTNMPKIVEVAASLPPDADADVMQVGCALKHYIYIHNMNK